MPEEKMIRLLGAGTLSVLVAILCLIFAIITRPKTDPQVKPATFSSYSVSNPQDDNSAQTVSQNETVADNSDVSSQIAQSESTTQDSAVQKYTVESGDTLYGIAIKFDKNWKEIAKANNISEATSLQAGQELTIP